MSDIEKSDTEKLDTKKDIKKSRKNKKQNTESNVEKITHNVKVWEKFIVNKTS